MFTRTWRSTTAAYDEVRDPFYQQGYGKEYEQAPLPGQMLHFPQSYVHAATTVNSVTTPASDSNLVWTVMRNAPDGSNNNWTIGNNYPDYVKYWAVYLRPRGCETRLLSSGRWRGGFDRGWCAFFSTFNNQQGTFNFQVEAGRFKSRRDGMLVENGIASRQSPVGAACRWGVVAETV